MKETKERKKASDQWEGPQGGIIQLSSMAAEKAMPKVAIYAGSKTFNKRLSEVLKPEL
jgi:short-subunit dehydrogenase